MVSFSYTCQCMDHQSIDWCLSIKLHINISIILIHCIMSHNATLFLLNGNWKLRLFFLFAHSFFSGEKLECNFHYNELFVAALFNRICLHKCENTPKLFLLSIWHSVLIKLRPCVEVGRSSEIKLRNSKIFLYS